MYVVVGLLLTLFSLIELGKKRVYRFGIFNFLILIITLLLCFRYGQGTDYYGYYVQYHNLNASGSFFANSLHHGELGWYIILVLAKRVGMSFEVFIGMISVVMMGSLYRAIRKYSPYGITSLLVFYPTYYLTYCFSAIRQGLVMSLFIGFGLELLIKKKYLCYYLLIFILILFHRTAIVLLILPLILHFKDKHLEKWFLVAVIAGVVFGYTGILNSVAERFGILSYFSVSISYMAIILRIILFYIVYKLHNKNILENEERDKVEDTLYLLYLTGFIVYLALAFSATLSQRLSMCMKSIEIILLPLIFANIDHKLRQGIKSFIRYVKIGSIKIAALVVVVLFILNIETIKNINSYIDQGNYYSWVNAINYPYSSVFDKGTIRNYLSHFDEEVE